MRQRILAPGCRSLFRRSSTRSIEVYSNVLIRIVIFATADSNIVNFSIFILIFPSLYHNINYMHSLINIREGDWGLLFRERRSLSSFRVLDVPPATLLFVFYLPCTLS